LIRPDQIPPEVVEAIKTMCGHAVAPSEIIAAALSAWPGIGPHTIIGKHSSGEWRQPIPCIILPLTEGDGQ
jgi:hypothetical protein